MAATLDDLALLLRELPQRLALAVGPARNAAGQFVSPGGTPKQGGGAVWPKVEDLGAALGRFVPLLGQLANVSRDARGVMDAWQRLQGALRPAAGQTPAPPTGAAPGAPQALPTAAPVGVQAVRLTGPFPLPVTLRLPPRLPGLNPRVLAAPPLPPARQLTGPGGGPPAPPRWPASPAPPVVLPLASFRVLGDTVTGPAPARPWPAPGVVPLLSPPRLPVAPAAALPGPPAYPVPSPGSAALPSAGAAPQAAGASTTALPPGLERLLRDLLRALQENTRAQEDAGGDATENEERVPKAEARGRSLWDAGAAVAQKAGVPPWAAELARQLRPRLPPPAGGLRPSQNVAGGAQGGEGGGGGGLAETVAAVARFFL